MKKKYFFLFFFFLLQVLLKKKKKNAIVSIFFGSFVTSLWIHKELLTIVVVVLVTYHNIEQIFFISRNQSVSSNNTYRSLRNFFIRTILHTVDTVQANKNISTTWILSLFHSVTVRKFLFNFFKQILYTKNIFNHHHSFFSSF